MTAPPGSARAPREPETPCSKRAVLARAAALGAGALALAAPPWSRAAEAWPERAVRLVCAGAPGSSPDVAARLYAERLSAR